MEDGRWREVVTVTKYDSIAKLPASDQNKIYFLRILSMDFPLANSSISLSR
ncbi:hypothetical protein [Chryseobacterium wanjuense]